MIYKFQPFSTTKELGKEYNYHCSIVPNETDWILLMDYDAMILTPETYTVIEKAIETNPETEIFTAWTNRIGLPWQRLYGEKELDTNDSIIHHLKVAKEQAAQFSEGESVAITTAAGFFLLFRKSYWQRNKFQDTIIDQHGRMFDWNFCFEVMNRENEGKIKLI
jgi:hypothetical protein